MSKKILPKWTAGNLVKIWCPDAPPETPSAYDDEFNDEVFNISKWTEYDPQVRQTISEEKYGLNLLIPTPPAIATGSVTGIYQSLPEGDFSISTKVTALCKKSAYHLPGIALFEDATDTSKKILNFCLYIASPTSTRLSLYSYSNYYTASTDPINLTLGNEATMGYFRIRRNSTTYYFDFSQDGISFITYYIYTSFPFAPSHMGLASDAVNYSGGQPSSVNSIFSFFRYINSDVGVAPIEGRLLNVKTF